MMNASKLSRCACGPSASGAQQRAGQRAVRASAQRAGFHRAARGPSCLPQSHRLTTRSVRLFSPAKKVVARRAGARMNVVHERSFVMVKPDGVQRGYVGEVISRFERKGYLLKGLKIYECDKNLAEEHYRELSDKPFFSKLVDYICSGPVVCMVWEGTDVVKAARKIIGATNPTDAEPGTIRGDFGVEVGRNLVHGSDSIENGEREIGLWFGRGEIADWESTMAPWIKELN